MELLPQQIKNKLKENHIATMKDDTVSHKPVVKYFTPFGAATWLISEIDDENMMFGLCDLGQGFPELGYVHLQDLYSLEPNCERDLYFKPKYTISQYADKSRQKGRIVYE